MNKYFLAKHVLQNEEFFLPLIREEVLARKYNSFPFAFDDVPESQRVLTTDDFIEEVKDRFTDIDRYVIKYIEGLTNVSGIECMQLIRLYNDFTEQTHRVVGKEKMFQSCEAVFLAKDYMESTVSSLFEYVDLEDIREFEKSEG